jgi:hypothetical protein
MSILLFPTYLYNERTDHIEFSWIPPHFDISQDEKVMAGGSSTMALSSIEILTPQIETILTLCVSPIYYFKPDKNKI